MTTDTITGISRQRLVTWMDPLATRDEMLAMDGQAFFSAVTSGSVPVPPMIRLMGFRIRADTTGQIVFEAEPAEYHYNPMGFVHGGFAATLLDSAIGYSILAHLPEGASFTTLELKVSYLRAMTDQTGTVHTDTAIVALGRQVASVESRLLDARGRVYATASSTCLILRPAVGPS